MAPGLNFCAFQPAHRKPGAWLKSASAHTGQHINKTESAMRITHEPINSVVGSQTERSQHANRDRAMKRLKAKLDELELQRRNVEKAALEASKPDIGWVGRVFWSIVTGHFGKA